MVPSARSSPRPPAATASRWWRGRGGNRGKSGQGLRHLVAFGPDGARLAFYRKIHLFDAQGFGESTFIKPSTDPVAFDCGGARFRLMTCYDLRFPELARSLADAGAQVVLVCSSWVPDTHKTEQWLALNAARAIENSVYVAGVCQAPPVGRPERSGGSDGGCCSRSRPRHRCPCRGHLT